MMIQSDSQESTGFLIQNEISDMAFHKNQYACDLHIHTALSPCGDDDMTPNNIVNMALLKELDFIAVTDHNSCRNVKSIMKCAKGRNLVIIPGMEVETAEEIHVLCLFPSLDKALEFETFLHGHLPHYPLKKDIFGNQFLLDENDEITGAVDFLLSTAIQLPLEDIVKKARKFGAVTIPSHIDRMHNSILQTFGFIPPELCFSHLEISHRAWSRELANYERKFPGYGFIHSSDAHRLPDILEREFFVDLQEKSLAAFFEYFKK